MSPNAVQGQIHEDRAPSSAAAADPKKVEASVTFENVSHWFIRGKDANVVLDNLSLSIAQDEFVAIVGPSGCGKTTALNVIAGLVRPEVGRVEVRVFDRLLSTPTPELGYMWVDDALLPWRSLLHNVEFGLEVAGSGRRERRARALEMIQLVGLAGAESRYPGQLSHGMRQRANLARLLAVEPSLFLMDEPFSALDAQTKGKLQVEFHDIWERHRRTVVYVTHDLSEAVLLADRILMMDRGTVVHDLPVPFGRPRSLDDLRFDQEFQEFTKQLWGMLGSLEQSSRSEGGRLSNE